MVRLSVKLRDNSRSVPEFWFTTRQETSEECLDFVFEKFTNVTMVQINVVFEDSGETAAIDNIELSF